MHRHAILVRGTLIRGGVRSPVRLEGPLSSRASCPTLAGGPGGSSMHYDNHHNRHRQRIPHRFYSHIRRRSGLPISPSATAASSSGSASSFSTSLGLVGGGPSPSDEGGDGENSGKLRVAIVGGGSTGLSAALHLAPLASAGLIAAPIDVYESSAIDEVHPHCRAGGDSSSERQRAKQDSSQQQQADEHFHPGSGSTGRPIGVGIWSTALQPFAETGRSTHGALLEELERMGRYVGQVGYRTPDGGWLARTVLDTAGCLDGNGNEAGTEEEKENKKKQPSLLFLREADLLSALKRAVRTEEEEFGTIRVHYRASSGDSDGDDGADAGSTIVSSIRTHNCHPATGLSGRLAFADGTQTPPAEPYHVIIAADGMHSTLRSRYAEHNERRARAKYITGAGTLSGLKTKQEITAEQREEWEEMGQVEANAIEDRHYTVFRGNAPLTAEEMGTGGVSFQTWGTGNSMRFAAVGMSYPSSTDAPGGDRDSEGRVERQVWFATTNDHVISSDPSPERRRELLSEAFASWHDPIGRLIESTPPDDILMERGVAHKHSVRPVLNLAGIVEHERRVEERERAKERGHAYRDLHGGGGGDDGDYDGGAGGGGGGVGGGDGHGPGPVLIFMGDASMTVDPVLAQGFTVGMEAAADLARTLERCCGPDFVVDVPVEDTDGDGDDGGGDDVCALQFDPEKLRSELKLRHRRRYRRMLSLLRTTELVQALAQPSGRLSALVTRWFLRPAMKLTPNVVKKPLFDYMLRWSLGLPEEKIRKRTKRSR